MLITCSSQSFRSTGINNACTDTDKALLIISILYNSILEYIDAAIANIDRNCNIDRSIDIYFQKLCYRELLLLRPSYSQSTGIDNIR